MSSKRPITMADIARLANVSKPTVSRSLSGSSLVNPKTRDRVLEVAKKHGYTVNHHAQKLRHQRSNTIALSIDFHSYSENYITDPFVFELLAGVSHALGKHNQVLLLTTPNRNDAHHLEQMINSRSVDGFIFLGQGHREEMLVNFASTGAPFVVWGAKRHKEPYCVVGSNNRLGGQLAGKYLISKGCRKILFIGDPSHNEIYWRFRGLNDATTKSGDKVKIDQLHITNFSYQSAYNSVMRYLESERNPPEGVFCYSDTAAMAVIHVLKKRGVKVPEDVAIVGYNDLSSSLFFSPLITTIRQNAYDAGEILVEKLIKIIEGETVHSKSIATELVIRET